MEKLQVPVDTLLTKAGEKNDLLHKVIKGEVLIFAINKTTVIPLGKIGPGDFIGELSYFDKGPSSAYAITLLPTELEVFKRDELDNEIPSWLKEFGVSLSKKIRNNDQALESSNYRPRQVGESIKLDIEEQRRIYKVVTQPK